MEPIYISRESNLWLAASDEAGVKLPASIVEARTAYAATMAAVKALARPDEPVNPAKLMDQGMDSADAVAEADRRHGLIVAWRREHDVLVQARSFKASALNRAVDEHLDDLVLAARPVVTALVEEARPLVPKLSRFAPAYDAEGLVAKATGAELKAYQAALALQGRLDVVHRAWTGSYVTPARVYAVGEPTLKPGTFGWTARDMEPAMFYWTEPSLVQNPLLNGRALSRTGRPLPPSTSLLLIAAEPEDAGFRLCIFDDLRERARLEWDTRHAASRYQGPRRRVVSF